MPTVSHGLMIILSDFINFIDYDIIADMLVNLQGDKLHNALSAVANKYWSSEGDFIKNITQKTGMMDTPFTKLSHARNIKCDSIVACVDTTFVDGINRQLALSASIFQRPKNNSAWIPIEEPRMSFRKTSYYDDNSFSYALSQSRLEE